jgi:N-acetylglucosaminyldiphosphoundecaprenol N-acetyl-beta-D-mannosaminyltransferase
MTQKYDTDKLAFPRKSEFVLGVRLNPMTKADAVMNLVKYAENANYGYVCFAEAHMIMQARRDVAFRRIVNGSLMTTTDGTPVRWLIQLLGNRKAETVDGPGITPLMLLACAEHGLRVGFYGSAQATLDQMVRRIRGRYPTLEIAYSFSPPFRPLTPQEDEAVVADILRSGVQILFVSLGCPKQERWMAEHSDRLSCILLGVGAVFDFLGGRRKMAPPVVQRAGLTWLYRSIQEPRRMSKRVLYHLPQFLMLASHQLLMQKLARLPFRPKEDGAA